MDWKNAYIACLHIVTLVFCMIMLATSASDATSMFDSAFATTITGILGIWTPTPETIKNFFSSSSEKNTKPHLVSIDPNASHRSLHDPNGAIDIESNQVDIESNQEKKESSNSWQLIIAAIVFAIGLLFVCIMLIIIRVKKQENRLGIFYLGMLSYIIGLWSPSPTTTTLKNNPTTTRSIQQKPRKMFGCFPKPNSSLSEFSESYGSYVYDTNSEIY